MIHADPRAATEDLRLLWAYVAVDKPEGAFAVDLAAQVRNKLVHPLYGAIEPQVGSGVQYHVGRGRWIVFYLGLPPVVGPQLETLVPVLQHSQVDVNAKRVYAQTVRSSANPGLYFQFPADTEFVDLHTVFSSALMKIKETGRSDPLSVAPVRPAYWELVDLSDAKSNPTDAGRIEVKLFGGVSVRLAYSAEATESLGEVLVEAWPSVPFAWWKSTWITAVMTEAKGGTATPLTEVAFNRPGGLGSVWATTSVPMDHGQAAGIPLGSAKGERRLHCHGRVRALGIDTGSASGLFLCDPTPIADLSDVSLPATDVGVDFGTSRSTVVVKGGGAMEFPQLAFADQATFTTSTRNVEWLADALPITTAPAYDAPTAQPVLARQAETNASAAQGASYIVVESQLLRRKTALGGYARPLCDYTIRPSHTSRHALDSYKSLEFARDMKWDTSELGQERRVEYLSILLLLAAAEAASRCGARTMKVQYTYPLAFEPLQLRALSDAFLKAATRVEAWTGMTVALNAKPVSESIAGLKSLDRRGGQWQLTIDIGGGTTDFALWHMEGAKPVVLAADSVEFAGDLLLDPAGRVHPEGRQYAELQIHDGVFLQQSLSKARTAKPKEYAGYLGALDLWRKLIAEYAARLVAGAVMRHMNGKPKSNAEMRLSVVALGGGWNALDGYTNSKTAGSFAADNSEQRKLATEISERIAKLMKTVKDCGPVPNFVVDDLGMTLLREAPNHEAPVRSTAGARVPREKIAIAYGLLQATEDVKEVGTLTPNGFDEQDVSGTVVPWHHMAGMVDGAHRSFSQDSYVLTSPTLPVPSHVAASLEDLARRGSDSSKAVRHHLERATEVRENEVMRRRSALATVYRVVLAEQVRQQGS